MGEILIIDRPITETPFGIFLGLGACLYILLDLPWDGLKQLKHVASFSGPNLQVQLNVGPRFMIAYDK